MLRTNSVPLEFLKYLNSFVSYKRKKNFTFYKFTYKYVLKGVTENSLKMYIYVFKSVTENSLKMYIYVLKRVTENSLKMYIYVLKRVKENSFKVNHVFFSHDPGEMNQTRIFQLARWNPVKDAKAIMRLV